MKNFENILNSHIDSFMIFYRNYPFAKYGSLMVRLKRLLHCSTNFTQFMGYIGVSHSLLHMHTCLENRKNFTPNFSLRLGTKHMANRKSIGDFKKEAINAAMNVFTATEFFGCLFHLIQNVFHHIQQLPKVLARYVDIER